MKNSSILESIKELTQFGCIIEGNKMLCYNKSLRPVIHYEVVDNKFFAVQLNMSYTEIKSFTEFRVNSFNKINGTNYELIFEFAK